MVPCYLGEIRMFAGDYAPANWLPCDGQELQIADEQALFSLIGTTYGGNGTTTFRVPDLRGRVAVGSGRGDGLSDYTLGAKGGDESVALKLTEAGHFHPVMAASVDGTEQNPAGNVVTKERQNFAAPGALTPMSPKAVGEAGSGIAHENRQPYVTVNYIIARRGRYPSS